LTLLPDNESRYLFVLAFLSLLSCFQKEKKKNEAFSFLLFSFPFFFVFCVSAFPFLLSSFLLSPFLTSSFPSFFPFFFFFFFLFQNLLFYNESTTSEPSAGPSASSSLLFTPLFQNDGTIRVFCSVSGKLFEMIWHTPSAIRWMKRQEVSSLLFFVFVFLLLAVSLSVSVCMSVVCGCEVSSLVSFSPFLLSFFLSSLLPSFLSFVLLCLGGS
jgi:hypothetical protein